MVIQDPGNEVPCFLFDNPDTPVKYKSVSQFYSESKSEVESPSSDSDSYVDSEEWTDSEKPAKRRRTNSLQKSGGGERTTTFRTLAQLLEPHSKIERIKPLRTVVKRACNSRNAAKRVKRFYNKSVARRPRVRGRRLDGNIGLVVELVFSKEAVEDGLSRSNSVDENGVNNKVPPPVVNEENLVSQENSDMEEEQRITTMEDPLSLSVARVFTKHAQTVSSISPFRSQLKWREIDIGGTDPLILVNRKCKVFSAIEDNWLAGLISEYDQQSKRHLIKYDAHGENWHFLSKERVAFHISLDEKIRFVRDHEEVRLMDEERKNKSDELLVLAASTESLDRVFHHGDVVWAESPGYPMWPAIVMDEQHAKSSGLDKLLNTLPVHYFGTHESARINCNRVVKFSKGLIEDYHLKCCRISFDQALEEAHRYFKDRKLPEAMVYIQEEVLNVDKDAEDDSEENEDFVGDERKYKVRKSLESIFKCPIKLGALRILNLGKIVKDSEYFHDQHYIWTEGYTSTRKFFSMKDPTKTVNYKMEIIRNPNIRTMPLFRVTPEDWEQVEGPSAAACWKKIFDKLHKARNKLIPHINGQADKRRQFYRSGAAMFGLSHPRVSRLIQALPYARVCSKFKVWAEAMPFEDLDGLVPAGFKHVEAEWKHLDRCSVCDTNEEFEGNVLLQCDKCRMLVHRNCYGVLEAPGDSWLCNLCDSNAPRRLPPCCLCPIKGGAMKRTTDGRWVHLACALWIPETCCVDMDRMEPIEGIDSINKERWKLTCSICSVPYGACIQCADHHCRVSYHPLCARAAGLSTKVLEGLRRKRNRATGTHEEERSVQLLSYCKKHVQKGDSPNAKPAIDSSMDEFPYTFTNPTGCARSEPYNFAIRRGRREPEHYSAALAKRAFLENRPHIVTGCLRNPYRKFTKCSTPGDSKAGTPLAVKRKHNSDDSQVAMSTTQRFLQMRSSLHHRLTFGKSAIHGWGLFAKQPHEAGDMVIEYAGEIIRPVVGDVREKSCYNYIVGAGTYMFCIDNERVIDATRAGSIAHLINHSCEPNCYSRVVVAQGRERIIIFAKKDIAGGEEVTYDYRFTSMGEQLVCHCGSAGCRGIVNVMDEEDESGRILVKAAEVTTWEGDYTKMVLKNRWYV